MTPEETLLMTDGFFESGFNGQPWVLSENSEHDIFYFDIKTMSQNQSLLTELKTTLSTLQKRFSQLTIVDDSSVEANILKLLGPQIPTIRPSGSQQLPLDFISLCNRKYQLDDSNMIHALYLAETYKKPLLFSAWQVRILNVNYRRSQKATIGSPYIAYVENERFHRLRFAQMDLGVSMSYNFLNTNSSLWRSFFFHPDTSNWFHHEACQQPHNYQAERKILNEVLEGLGGEVRTCNHNLNLGPSLKLEKVPPVQQASFPIHVLFEKIFQETCPLNQTERALYGL